MHTDCDDNSMVCQIHDDVIKWKHFPRYWPFVWRIHLSSVNSPHKGQWRGAWAFSLMCAWINGWVNSRMAGDLRRHRAHYDVIVMTQDVKASLLWSSAKNTKWSPVWEPRFGLVLNGASTTLRRLSRYVECSDKSSCRWRRRNVAGSKGVCSHRTSKWCSVNSYWPLSGWN